MHIRLKLICLAFLLAQYTIVETKCGCCKTMANDRSIKANNAKTNVTAEVRPESTDERSIKEKNRDLVHSNGNRDSTRMIKRQIGQLDMGGGAFGGGQFGGHRLFNRFAGNPGGFGGGRFGGGPVMGAGGIGFDQRGGGFGGGFGAGPVMRGGNFGLGARDAVFGGFQRPGFGGLANPNLNPGFGAQRAGFAASGNMRNGDVGLDGGFQSTRLNHI